jgi:hypothetical protein
VGGKSESPDEYQKYHFFLMLQIVECNAAKGNSPQMPVLEAISQRNRGVDSLRLVSAPRCLFDGSLGGHTDGVVMIC